MATTTASTPYGSNYVGGDGPMPCEVMLIGEGPGEDENRAGRPFVGKSGVELWRYLWRGCQLTRDDVYTTNLVKYRVPENGDPTEGDIQRDADELASEIVAVNPKFVLCLGRFATRNFLGDVDMDAVHGISHRRAGRTVLPCIHPAAGLHNTEFQAKIAWDFEQAGKSIRRQADAPVERFDGHLDVDYCEAPSYFNLALAAVDTEGSAARPWCLSATGHAGSATVVRRRGAAQFRHIILHNSLHDLDVLDALEVEFETFDDTMIMAYELGIEPQGLKNLARRHCGMVMKSYEEVLGDAQRRHNEQWLSRVLSSESVASGPTTRKKGQTKSISGRGGKRSARTSRTKPRR